MARAALPGRLNWLEARVAGERREGARARTLRLDVPGWPGHRAGQHVDVRLTAEDGYQAQRSYSIASAPEDDALELTVERLRDGEVSPYLVDELRPGDAFELRGPVGSHFTWAAQDGGPVLCVAGGSGVVPFRAMLRHAAAAAPNTDLRVVVSARTRSDLLFADELAEAGAMITLTRSAPPGWRGPTGRVDASLLEAAGPPPAAAPRCFVCGPTGFVGAATRALVELGHAPRRIAAERFGPS